MLALHPRVVVASAAEDGGHDEGRACYCVVVACVSLLLFVVLAAATGSVARACAITAAAAILFGLAGWAAPALDGAPAAGAQRQQAGSAPAAAVQLVVHRRCACGLADEAIGLLPAFAYEPLAAAAKGSGSVLLCAVCLEDVRAGEMVRQLPACHHLFHADCVDAWLRAHRTCPLCRCDLSQRNLTAKAAAAAAVTVESSPDALPPV